MTSKYLKPSLILLGPSTYQMRKSGLIKRKVRPKKEDPADDNGKVMTGEAFKWLKG